MPFNIVMQMKLSGKKKNRRHFHFQKELSRPDATRMNSDIRAGTFVDATFHFHFCLFHVCDVLFTGLYLVCLVFDHLCGGQDVYQL